ncbi:MAG TPA: hypothetical protein VN328_08870 [Thermodesulfovibrionales bacterium]|nr:hypothetical protein [Thermodesulfovibrionales bacterium]
MKAISYSRITSLLLALVFIPAPIINASDISSLSEKMGPRVKEVIARPTISRVSELPRLPVSLRQYEFLIDHPRLSMILAHIYDPSLDLYKMEVRPDGLIHVDDLAGLVGDMELINSVPGRRVYSILGHSDILRMRFHGHMILMISYSECHGEAGASVDSTTTGYIKVDSAFVGVFTRLMALLFPKAVDERIGRIANAAKIVAVAVQKDPVGVYGKLAASGQVGSEELKEFAAVFLRRV